MKKITLLILACTVLAYLSAEILTEDKKTSVSESFSKKNEDTNNLKNYLPPPATCFAPDTDPAVVASFYENREAIFNSLGIEGEEPQGFNLATRWFNTAIDGPGLGQGDFTTLTWSYVPDGTPIGNGGCGVPGESGNSDFIAFFNGIYGPPAVPGDFTTAPWHAVFVDMFTSWSNASGILFVYEPNDDGSIVVSGGPGVVGLRGDFRISGHTLDGNSGVLACNYFPDNGDMIIDTSDNFYANNPGIGTTNVLTHEIGHGLGISHVCPVEQTKLMEPFVTTAFNGPQEDDILATNRGYGDPDDDNDTPGTAVLLGANPVPTSYNRLQRSIDDNSEVDYFSFTINSAAILAAELDPTGTTYLEGVQNPGGSCSAGTNFNAATISDLMVEILDTDGTTVLATANANGPGVSENITALNLPAAGTYFVRVSQQGTPVDNVQMYNISVDLTGGVANDPPTALCQNFTAQLDGTGNVTITGADVDNGSSDPDGPVTLSVNPSSFTCADIGTTTVTLTVTDNTGQTDTCTATVTIEDIEPPTAICQNFTAQLDATGNVTITEADIDDFSFDNCSIASITISQSTFTCADVGPNSVTLTVTDDEGNVDSCNATVTVEDLVIPTAICQNFTTQLDATGNATITAANIDNGSSDACGIASVSVSPSAFTCADVGANTVTLTVTDVNGNVATCTSTVTIEDTELPIAVCQNFTAQLDATGNVTITGANIDNGSSDNCGIASLSVSPDTFTCADIGTNTVTLTVTDVDGNVATCTSTVTVEDMMPPTATCQDITVQLDGTGNATISGADVDNGSTDNCGSVSLTVSPDTFTCADVGANTVTLTVTDTNGDTATCTATVTVEDMMMPTATCQDITTQLDATGNATITAADVDNGSADNCGIASLSVSPNAFTCANVGANTVTLTVTDVNGNVTTCTSTVTIEDTVLPIATCQDVTVQLDGTGNASVTAGDIDNGSTDNCGIASVTVSPSTFTCADVGANTVTLTVTDVDGNIATCTSTVTVEDIILPTAVCQDITVQIDASGNATIDASDIDNGSTDNCDIASVTVSPNAFTCGDVGANTVTLTVTDVNGNVATCTSTVTVEDNTVTSAICRNITALLDENGTVLITPADIDDGPADNCNIVSTTVTPDTFTCADIGPNIVTLTKTDVNGNQFTCTSIVNVVDNLMPIALCQNITVEVDASCTVTIAAADIDNGSSDNCEIASIEVSPDTFTCTNVGDNTVTLTVTDTTGNVSTCTAIVTVEQILGVENIAANLSTISLFPNPAKEMISIANPDSIDLTQMVIHDILGRVVATHDLSTLTSNSSFNVSNLQSGNYIVIIRSDGGQTVKRFIKQ